LRIIFAGTPEFAAAPLQSLLTGGFTPQAVLTQPDRPAGRGRKLQASPVKVLAQSQSVEVYQPAALKDSETRKIIARFEPDLMIVVAYGLLLPRAVLGIPVHGCWNIHASLLPRWRGAAPIQRCIEAGDTQSGVCIMQMDEGLDTGPVLHTVRTRLDASETGGSLHDRLARMGSDALMHCVRMLAAGDPPRARRQEQAGVSYARKLDKSEARLDWNEPAVILERRIRAFNPWPVAWCDIAGERTRIWRAALVDSDHDAVAGTVLRAQKQGIDVATGDGVLRLLELQKPGSRKMSAADYLNARRLPDHLDGPP
jgi:methionyl-tRNA formyltransferase